MGLLPKNSQNCTGAILITIILDNPFRLFKPCSNIDLSLKLLRRRQQNKSVSSNNTSCCKTYSQFPVRSNSVKYLQYLEQRTELGIPCWSPFCLLILCKPFTALQSQANKLDVCAVLFTVSPAGRSYYNKTCSNHVGKQHLFVSLSQLYHTLQFQFQTTKKPTAVDHLLRRTDFGFLCRPVFCFYIL